MFDRSIIKDAGKRKSQLVHVGLFCLDRNN